MKTMTTLRSRVSTLGVLLVTFISATIALTALADVPTCVPAPPGLVGWWAGESNANDSAGTNQGALYGGMSFAAGEAGQAFKFNGGSGYVEMPASASLDVGAGAGLTFECWIKPATLADAQPLVEWNSGAHAGLHLWISQPPPYGSGSGSIYVNLIDTTGAFHTLCTAAGMLNTNSFQHVALSYDKASGMTSLYYNGALVALGTLGSFSPQTSVPLYLGKRISDAPFVAFNGLMDEASLYRRALSAAEIQTLYNADGAGKCLNRASTCATPPSGLVSWWRAEANGLDQVGGNNGVLLNGAGFDAGVVGQAFRFSASGNSYVEVPDSPALRFTNALTIECWAKRLNPAEVHILVEKGGDWTGGQTDFEVALNDTYYGGSHFGFSSGGCWRGCAVTPDTAWHHYAAVAVSGQANPILYIDGVPQAVTLGGGPATMTLSATTRPLHIGAQIDQQTGWLYYSSTVIDEPAIYSRALSAAEIQAIYSAGSAGKCVTQPPTCAAPPAGLVSWWRGEGAASDSAGTNSGVLEGGVTYAAGEVGQAFRFNGTNADVRLPASASLNVGLSAGFTIETWINPADITQQHPLVEWNDGSFGVHLWIAGDGPGALWFDVKDTGLNDHVLSSAAGLLVSNVWQHVAATYTKSNGNAVVYLNGVPRAQANLGVVTPRTLGDLYFGLRPYDGGAGMRFAGLMDEVSLYNRALSAAEIQAIYSADGAGKCPVGVAPSITTQPASQTVLAGSNVTFTATAAGTTPLSYQWRFNGTNIAGATGTALTLSNVQPALAGNYAVLVTNAFGSITSSNALLTVCSLTNGWTAYYPFNGNANDASGNGNNGVVNGATLTADRFGLPNSAYRFNGTSWIQLPDTVEPPQPSGLTLSAWVLADSGPYDAGAWLIHLSSRTGEGGIALWNASSCGFWVKLQNSNPQGYYANEDTVITNVWTHLVAVYKQGQFVEFWVNGSLAESNTIPNYALYTDPTFPLNSSIGNYDYAPVPYNGFSGAMDDVRIYNRALSSVEVQALYQCEATPPDYPIITQQPQSRTVSAGSNVTFTATASGRASLSYQWRLNGTNITGATGTSLALSNVQPALAGNYTLRVTNAYGSAISSNAVLAVNPASGCATPPAGLVSWWRAEANGLDQVGGNNGVLLNGAGFDAGMVGQAFRVSGSSNSYVEVPDSPALRFTNALTYECWVKRLNTSQVHTLVEKGGSWTGGQIDFESTLNDTYYGGSHFGFAFSGGWRGCAVTPDTAWHHYAAVAVSGQANPILYIDGVPQPITFGGGPATMTLSATTRPLHIGALVDPQTGWTFYSDTLIDELAIYSRALSAAEIQAIYQAGSAGKCLNQAPPCATPPAGMVSWWRAEGDTSDYAGSNSGIVQGGVAFAPGRVGQAFGFNGTNSYINVPSSPALKPTGPFTVEGWVNYNMLTDASGDAIITKGQDAEAAMDWSLVIGPGQKLVPCVNVAGRWAFIYCASTLATGVWYHVAMVYDGSSIRGYVNGGLDGTKAASGTVQATDYPLRIGAYAPINGTGSKGYVNGRVDELSFYGRALSAAEIQAVYNAGSAGKCLGPIPPYILSQPTSQVVTVGQKATFSAIAGGTPPLTYQWQINGTNLTGATSTVLTITNAQISQSGSYAVIVTNLAGSITSSNALLTVNPAPPCVAAPSGLVSWWRGEGDASDAAGSNNGTLQGTVTFGPGWVGQAAAFNGTNSYINVPSSPGLKPTGPFTLEGWINYSMLTGTSGDAIAAKGQDAENVMDWALVIGPGQKLVPCVNVAGHWTFIYCASTLATDVWYHVAMVYDGSSIRGYVNGGLDGTIAASGTVQATDYPLRIGAYAPVNGTGSKGYVNGRVDELSFYGRALSASEIQAAYNAGGTGKCPPGVAPSIITQPASQTVLAGSNVTFTVAAAGTTPLSYQWRWSGTNIAGATGSSLALSNVQPAQAGSYSVLVTNVAGSVISSNAVLTINSPAQCVPPPSGLVGWWAGESNALDSMGSNSGSVQGGATFAPGVVGQAFSFNPASGTILVPDSPSLRLTSQLTIEAWIKPSTLSGSGGYVIVSKLGGAGGNNGYQFNLVGNKIQGLFNSPGQAWPSASLFSGSIVTTGVWYHVAYTYDQSAMKLYCNGLPVATNVIGAKAIATSTSNLHISGDDNSHSYFDGLIDEPTVYNRALSATEVAAIYQAGSSGKCGFPPSILAQPQDQTATAGANVSFIVAASGSSPLSYQWQLNSAPIAGATASSLVVTNLQDTQAGTYRVVVSNPFGSATSSNAQLTVLPAPPCATPPAGLVSWWAAEGNALDLAGTNNGTLQGAATFAPGLDGQAFNFDPANGTVVVPDSPSLRLTNQLTIEAWIKARSLSGSGGYVIVSKLGGAGGNNGYQFNLVGNTIQGLFNSPGQAWPSASLFSGPIITPGVWYHVAYTYDQSAMKLYCNGQPVATNVIGAKAIATSISNLHISGDDNSHSYFDGLIDEPTVYNRALSADEIAAIYNAGSSGKCKTSGTLLNVNFAAYTQVKVGFAGTGQTATDFWNNYTAPFQSRASLSNLTMADGTPTTVGLTVQNGAGHWAFTHPDLMYNCYCYSQNNGDITVTVTNLPSGQYDFYFYGHGNIDRANTVFQVLVGGADYGNRPTGTNSDSLSTNWLEGAQYVVYRNVAVTNGGVPVTIVAHPGSSGYALLNGMQISLAAAGAQVQAQPAQVVVIAPSGSTGATMQLEIRGAPGRVYAIQASTNVTDWVTIGLCVPDTGGSVRFTDPDADKYPTRLYRVVGR